MVTQEKEKLYKVVLTGLMAALSYVVFTYLQIKIHLPGGDATSIHLGNAVCVLGALFLGGAYGGLGGAIGMTLGDLFDPIYVIYAPKTFVLKLMIGLVTGVVAHKVGKISESNDHRHVFKWTVLAAGAGLLFNVVFDPLVGYFYKLWMLGKPAADLVLTWNIVTTSINAFTSTITATVVYLAVRPTLRKAGMLLKIT